MTTSTIADLNDAFRRSAGSSVHATSGIMDRGPAFLFAALRATRSFDAFTPDNDPYGEHDFGSFELHGQQLFWKIDCYAQDDFTRGSEDPADSAKTSRVLTIMLASEY